MSKNVSVEAQAHKFGDDTTHTQTQEMQGRRRLLGGGAGGGGDVRPDLTPLNIFSPVFFFSCVIKSGVSGVGARVGRGALRGVSRR